MKRYDHALEKAMDAAISTLAAAIRTSGHNEKPVIMHSIRVGIELFNRGYSREAVLAGLLHDILEDSGFTEESLRLEYGDRITELVRAATLDRSISDRLERERELFLRCASLGRDALLVKCADIYDNIDYFEPTEGCEELDRILVAKYRLFLEAAAGELEGEAIFADLRSKVARAEAMMREAGL